MLKVKLGSIKKIVFFTALSAGIFFGCKKAAGEGGKATIKGNIWVEDWNGAFTIKNGEYAGYDHDVYIVYGEAGGYSDRTRANYNGEYEFRYLRKGKYKIYVYSKDNTLKSLSGDTAFVKEVEITKNKQTLTLDKFTVYE
jgi:hypothetical protein